MQRPCCSLSSTTAPRALQDTPHAALTTRRASARSARRVGFGFGCFPVGLSRFVIAFCGFFRFFFGLGAVVLEISRVPTAALQLESGGTDQLVERALPAFRAVREQRIAHSL